MSQATKQSMIILIVLLIGSFGFGGYALLQKQNAESQNISLQKDIDAYQSREKKYILDITAAEDKFKQVEAERNKLQSDLAAVDVTIQKLNEEIQKIVSERDQFKTRADTIQKERDALTQKMQNQPEKIVYKYIEREPEASAAQEQSKQAIVSLEGLDDSYWAQVLKEKATMEVKVDSLKKEVSEYAVQIEELKKKNSDAELELSKVKIDKDAIDREIKHAKDVADTLSLELARSKSDKKFAVEQFDNIRKENDTLRSQIKELSTTKIALEKSIVRLTEDKSDLQKKLVGTEEMIQGKIEEVWDIKKTLNDKLKEAKDAASNNIELSPIVVSARVNSPEDEVMADASTSAGLAGQIISVNEDNNFIIVDKGETSGVKLGDKLNVYRGPDFIAQVEVIQVRTDVSAADIREKRTKIKVGDSVR